MWQPYINSVEANLPPGKKVISHDPFHVIQNMNKSVDHVPRQENGLVVERGQGAA